MCTEPLLAKNLPSAQAPGHCGEEPHTGSPYYHPRVLTLQRDPIIRQLAKEKCWCQRKGRTRCDRAVQQSPETHSEHVRYTAVPVTAEFKLLLVQRNNLG